MSTPLDRAVAGTELYTVFQPIVSLIDGAVVGYEALSRWPSLQAAAVFARASVTDQAPRLDYRCIESALATAATAGIQPGSVVSINTEALGGALRRSDSPALAGGAQRYQIMFELTERHLLNSPRDLLRHVDSLRSDGFAVALDDVGVQRDSCALFDVVSPDVIKLDLGLVQHQPTPEQARTLTAVLAYREKHGTTIMAEGIEDDDHLEQALALGADLGQGYLLGHPATVPPPVLAPRWMLPHIPADTTYRTGTPFDLVKNNPLIRSARKETLVTFSRSIENHALHAADQPIIFAAIQHGRFFTGQTRRHYLDLASRCPLVAIFGQQLPPIPNAARPVAISPSDPLARQWVVVALGGHTASALVARETNSRHSRDFDRRFDFVLTHDRPLVAAIAKNLMSRIA